MHLSLLCTVYIIVFLFIAPPSPPCNLSVSDSGLSWASLQWKNPQNLMVNTGFEVTVFHNNGRDSKIVQISEGLNSYNVTGLESNGSYDFTVVAFSRAGSVIGRSLPSNRAHFSGNTYMEFKLLNCHVHKGEMQVFPTRSLRISITQKNCSHYQ